MGLCGVEKLDLISQLKIPDGDLGGEIYRPSKIGKE